MFFDDIRDRKTLALKRDAFLLGELGFVVVDSKEEATHYFDRDSKTYYSINVPVKCRRIWWLAQYGSGSA